MYIHAFVAASMMAIGTVRAATMTTTTSSSTITSAPLCEIPAFLNQLVNGDQYCCAGSLDIDQDKGQVYCCVGNNNVLATNTATSFEADRTGTIASCSTKIYVTEKHYTSKVEAAGTKYAVSYVATTRDMAGITRTLDITPTSTGGAAQAAKTPAMIAAEAIFAAGAVLLVG